ncbi:MAG: hypothetical protein M3Q40_02795 [Pseudomonadota bacterium]|nr:hypothetical protein [Pseudomonadota bacterium]
MSVYNDIYLRQSLSQLDPAHDGGSTAPDIQPWGLGTAPNPNALGVAPGWDRDLGVGLVPGAVNHVYVRARNPSTTARGAQLFVGRAAPALLCWPDWLTAIPTGDGKPCAELKIPATTVGVPQAGFVFTPDDPGEALAAWVYTAEHPLKLPKLTDVVALREFIAGTPGYVQRSVGFGIGTDNTYKYRGRYEQRDLAQSMVIEIAWRDAPVGWVVSLLPVGGGAGIRIDPVTIVAPLSSVMVQPALAAGYTDLLELVIDTKGIAPLAGTRVDVQVSMLVESPQGVPIPHDVNASRLLRMGGHSWRTQPTPQ